MRRKEVPKSNGKLRPLGIPTWSDKLVQEVIRSILEAYYDPQFSDNSHGFRPNRGCLTALSHIQKVWMGTKWFIEGDIKGCFDNIDHTILMSIIRTNIKDNRFTRLVEGLLKAGYCEQWTYHPSHSGTPQGSIVSPILANIYMDRLDKFVEQSLMPALTRGKRRTDNTTYNRLHNQMNKAKQYGKIERIKTLRKAMQQLPSVDPYDEGYRRLRYIRYADDFLLGLVGTRAEAEEIKASLTTFLGTELKLTLAAEKTLITHAQTGRAKFLGYDIGTLASDTKMDTRKHRSVNGKIGFYIPDDVIPKKSKRYMRDGKPIHRPELLNDSEYDNIILYQGEYRGLVNYYGLAHNLQTLSYLQWIMRSSLLKTLARKGNTTVAKVATKLQATTQTTEGPRKCLKVIVPRAGKTPLVAVFGGISLRRRRNPAMQDQVTLPYARKRSEIIERLLNDTCEVCGSKKDIQMHHIRRLADLNKQGRREKPEWMKIMISRQRKSIPLCARCHNDIHHNRPRSKT